MWTPPSHEIHIYFSTRYDVHCRFRYCIYLDILYHHTINRLKRYKIRCILLVVKSMTVCLFGKTNQRAASAYCIRTCILALWVTDFFFVFFCQTRLCSLWIIMQRCGTSCSLWGTVGDVPARSFARVDDLTRDEEMVHHVLCDGSEYIRRIHILEQYTWRDRERSHMSSSCTYHTIRNEKHNIISPPAVSDLCVSVASRLLVCIRCSVARNIDERRGRCPKIES